MSVEGIFLMIDKTCERREGWDDRLLEMTRPARRLSGVVRRPGFTEGVVQFPAVHFLTPL